METTKIQALIQVPSPIPFDYFKTMRFQANYRKRSGSDYFENGIYMKAMRIKGQPVILEIRQSQESESIELRIVSPSVFTEHHAAAEALSQLLGFDLDLTEFDNFVKRDEVLNPLIGDLKGLRLTRTATVYEALVSAIIGQQISAAVAGVIRENFLARYGSPLVTRQGPTLYVFPEPAVICKEGIDVLRTLKLSGKKAEYIYEISQRAALKELDYDVLCPLTNDEVIDQLTQIRGIGRWTAEWVLLRSLGRLDAIPSGDLALQRMVGMYYFGTDRVTEEELGAFALKYWAPFRGLITLYLFAFLRESRERLLEAAN